MKKSEFFSHISDSWDSFHDDPMEMAHLKVFSRHFRLQPGESVLDVGCGSGRLISLVCEQIGSKGRLVELDFASGMLAIGRCKPHPGNVSFVLGDVHALTFPESEFDKIIALAIVPHIDDKAKAFGEFHRVLKPGGQLIIAHQMGRESLDKLHQQSSDPVSRDFLPGNDVLIQMLSTAGFSGLEIVDELDQFVAWAKA